MNEIRRNKYLPFVEIKQGLETVFPIRDHSHEELSFGFIEHQSNKITCKTLEFEMNVGDTILIPPNAIHLCLPQDKQNFKFMMLYIDPKWFGSVFGIDAYPLAPQTARLGMEEQKLKNRFFNRFTQFDDLLKAETEAIFFIGELIFNIFNIKEPILQINRRENKIELVKKHLEQNFSQQIQLDDLAELYGKSKFSLLRSFKRTYKLTPHAYLLNKRINQAKKLLRKGETVAQTAVNCGFFDQSHFVKTFRKFVGMNPIDYK